MTFNSYTTDTITSTTSQQAADDGTSSKKKKEVTTAVIFDYDWSLINCNSDTYIFHQLWPERPNVVEETYRDITQQWTAAVDKSLELLQQTKPHLTAKDILACVAHVPVLDGMLQAAKYAHQQGAKLYIVSDANTMFIDVFLQEQKLQYLFEAVERFSTSIIRSLHFRIFLYSLYIQRHSLILRKTEEIPQGHPRAA